MTNRKELYDKCPEIDYFMNKDESDVVFVVNGQRLPANKLILSYKSFHFRAMFSDKYKFKENAGKEISINGTTFEAFQTFIRFLYCDHLIVFKDYNDVQLIGEVLKLCDKYLLSRLTGKIFKHLKSSNKSFINFENLTKIAEIAVKSNNSEAITQITQFIETNLNQIIRKDTEELVLLNDVTNDRLFEIMCNRLSPGEGLLKIEVKEGFLVIVEKHLKQNVIEMLSDNDPLPVSLLSLKMALKYFYFNRLIFTNDKDFELIQGVCHLAKEAQDQYLLERIGGYYENRITFNNLNSISIIAIDYKIKNMIKSVNSFIYKNQSPVIDKLYEYDKPLLIHIIHLINDSKEDKESTSDCTSIEDNTSADSK